MKTCAAAVAIISLCAAPAFATPPLEAYGRLPTLSHVTLSPDGTMAAFVRRHENKQVVVIQTIGAQRPSSVIDIADQKLRDLQWADSSHLLITTGATMHKADVLVAGVYDLKKHSQHALIENVYSSASTNDDESVGAMNIIAGLPQPRIIDGQTYVFVPGVFFPWMEGQGQWMDHQLGLFRVNVATGSARVVSKPDDIHGEDWAVDEAGNVLAEAGYYEPEQRWKLKLYRNGGFETPVDVSAPIDAPEMEGLSEDGTAIVLKLPETEDRPSYQQISLKDGSSGPWQRSDLHLDDLIVDMNTGRVIGGYRITDNSDFVFFDPRAEMVWRSIKAAFKKATSVDLVSWSEDWTKIVVRAFGAGFGDYYFLFDTVSNKAGPIGSAYNEVDEIFPVQWIDYRATDGRVLHAYLTLPMIRDPKNLPLIVLPHGGPYERDYPGFNWFPQALASRGYAVLQPEFRGSGGFGYDLLSAGFGEFGKKMQTDLSDGARALAAQGLIDPKRVCIVGASYGGYAALAGATLDTGVYRCAIAVAGLSDLSAQLSFWHFPHDGLDDRYERYWDRFLGVSDPDDPKLDAISPIKHVDKVTIPILFIHGKDDTVVPFSESENMADALKAAGKQVEFVQLEGEDHWLSRSETRLQMLKATVKFLEENNPPDAAEASASNPSSSK
jgi:dipeptidyl aminopeptidase/acylaminoacyl peptidase